MQSERMSSNFLTGSSSGSDHNGSISSGLASSGFASEGFRSESYYSPENGFDIPVSPSRRRGRRYTWQSMHRTQTRTDGSGSSEQTSSLNPVVLSNTSTTFATDEQNSSTLPLMQSLLPPVTDDSGFPSGALSNDTLQLSDSTQKLRDFLFDVHGIVAWRDLAKEEEVRELSELLEIIENGGLSEQRIRALLNTRRVKARFSYDVLMSYLDRRSKVSKQFSLMCPLEHMATRGQSAEGSVCSSQNCELKIVGSHKFWYRYASEMISALCRERDSLKQLTDSCRRAKRAVTDRDFDTLYDFYDGALFRRKYRQYLWNWDEEQELYVFLTFSSDGFEEIGGHRGPRTA